MIDRAIFLDHAARIAGELSTRGLDVDEVGFQLCDGRLDAIRRRLETAARWQGEPDPAAWAQGELDWLVGEALGRVFG